MKKKILKFSMMTSIILLAASCTKQPTASFKLSKSTAAVGEIITATFDGENAKSYNWGAYDGVVTAPQFSGSGAIATITGGGSCDNAWSFNYTQPGTYTIILDVYNDKEDCITAPGQGKSDRSSQTITIQ